MVAAIKLQMANSTKSKTLERKNRVKHDRDSLYVALFLE